MSNTAKSDKGFCTKSLPLRNCGKDSKLIFNQVQHVKNLEFINLVLTTIKKLKRKKDNQPLFLNLSGN